MFKLVVLSGLLAVALAKPSNLVVPLVDKLVSEKTIESHGNSVIHAAAPVVTPVNIPLIKVDAQKVLPVGVPYVASAAPLASTAAPVAVVQTKLVETSERKQVSSEKSESSQQSKQLIEKVEKIAQQSNQIQSQEKLESNSKQSSEVQQRNETSQNKEYSQIIDAQGQIIYHPATPSILSPPGVTFTNALIPPYVVPAEVAVTLFPHRPTTDSSQKPQDEQKVKSAESKQQIAAKLDALENGVIQEVATGLHLAPAPLYFYPYPAAVVAEKSISSYGHSIVHGA